MFDSLFYLFIIWVYGTITIFKDEGYECEEVGIPFLAEPGRDVYEYELARKRKHNPDLSQLQALFKEVQ